MKNIASKVYQEMPIKGSFFAIINTEKSLQNKGFIVPSQTDKPTAGESHENRSIGPILRLLSDVRTV
jgi:hypothetical protein